MITTNFTKIKELIESDISDIVNEQNSTEDGTYSATLESADTLHTGSGTIERVKRNQVKGFEYDHVRIYVMSAILGFGLCILCTKTNFGTNHSYSIITLGEDDGYFFVRDFSSPNYMHNMEKYHFVEMLARATSLLNNIKI